METPSTVKCRHCKGTGRTLNQVLFGARMKKLRIKAGLTGADVSRRLGLSKAHVFNLEKGYRFWRPELIKRYTKALVST